MLSKKDVIKILHNEQEYIHKVYGVKRVGLFGSFALDKATESSDVDLILEFEKSPGLKFVQLAEYLEKKLGRKTDILTPAGLNSIRVPKVIENIKKGLMYV